MWDDPHTPKWMALIIIVLVILAFLMLSYSQTHPSTYSPGCQESTICQYGD
jgi:hypothetical protein